MVDNYQRTIMIQKPNMTPHVKGDFYILTNDLLYSCQSPMIHSLLNS